MTTAAERRRRACALAVAFLVTLLGVLAAPLAVGAQSDPCPITNPLCHSSTTSFEVTTTTDFSPTTQDTVPRDETSTTRRRTTTTDQATTSTARSVTVSTVKDLLVPGDGTKGAESTTTTIESLAKGSSGLSDDQLIVLIVGGLVVAAALVGVLMWRYWSATRPSPADRR